MVNVPIIINLLGDFVMKSSDIQIQYNDLSQQLTSLLAYLFVNRDQPVSINAISTALWNEDIANPASSVKNLVYRLRKTLQTYNFPMAKEIVMSFGGSYTVNNCLNFQLDIELVEQYLDQAANETKLEKQIEIYEKIMDLYNGEFLSNLPTTEWTVPYIAKYNNICFNVAYKLLEYYKENDMYDSIISMATKVLTIDNFEEPAHRYLMYAYYKKGQGRKAISYYSALRETFYKELGVEISQQTTELFDSISKFVNTSNMDINTLKADLKKEDNVQKTPFYCEYEVFRRLYQFMTRSIERTGYSVFMALITISSANDEELPQKTKEKGMKKLEDVINISLRSSDIFTRCSPNQYAIILSMINYENALKVMERIDKSFRKEYHTRKIQLLTALTAIEPYK